MYRVGGGACGQNGGPVDGRRVIIGKPGGGGLSGEVLRVSKDEDGDDGREDEDTEDDGPASPYHAQHMACGWEIATHTGSEVQAGKEWHMLQLLRGWEEERCRTRKGYMVSCCRRYRCYCGWCYPMATRSKDRGLAVVVVVVGYSPFFLDVAVRRSRFGCDGRSQDGWLMRKVFRGRSCCPPSSTRRPPTPSSSQSLIQYYSTLCLQINSYPRLSMPCIVHNQYLHRLSTRSRNLQYPNTPQSPFFNVDPTSTQTPAHPRAVVSRFVTPISRRVKMSVCSKSSA